MLDTDQGPEYEIDRIIAERGSGRRKEFRVRWLGYGPESDLWLRLSDLENA